MSKKLLAHLVLIMVTLVYGANYVIIKFVSPDPIGPSGLVLIRTAMAVVFFWIAGFFVANKKIDKEDWSRIILCAFCGAAFNQLCFFQGAVNTSPIDASLIMTTNPIIVLLFASVILKEKLTKNKFIGIALGCLGAILIIMQKEGNHNAPDRLYGNTMIFVNSILFGLYIVIVKPLITKYDTFTLMKWIFLFGFILLIPFGFEETMQVNWNFSTETWWAFIYASAVVTFLAYVPNILALRWVSSSLVSSYLYVQPIIAAGLAMLWLNEALSVSALFAAALIFVGVYLVGKE
jgi:drug/metabolite transporter (DMT)-like permease